MCRVFLVDVFELGCIVRWWLGLGFVVVLFVIISLWWLVLFRWY